MARMYPLILDQETESQAEKQLYEAFKHQLDDGWILLHHVKWIANDERGRPSDGETDFVVVNPNFGILVIEVKGGGISFDKKTGHFLSTDRHGLGHHIGDPFDQAKSAKYTLLNKLKSAKDWPKRRILIGHAVAFPDSRIDSDWLRPDAPREIIIDSNDMISLEGRLRKTLSFWKGKGDSAPGNLVAKIIVQKLYQADRVRHPLLAESARMDDGNLAKLTEKQFRYLKFLSSQRRAAIAGCVGSGKTFLALEKARQLSSEGLKVLLTCFNRPLADHLGVVLGYRKQFDVFSFHQMCEYWVKKAKIPKESKVSDPDYFNTTLPNMLMSAIDVTGPQYDAIIIDEGQDFRMGWFELLPYLLHDPDNGIFYVFYDNNQRLYKDRQAIPVGAAPYPLDENCRNTRRIFKVVNEFYTGTHNITSIGPMGLPVEGIPYVSTDSGVKQLRRILHRLINENGFKHNEIAVLTPLGTKSSDILGLKLGNIELSEKLPLAANEVLATTVRKFKGLERAAVVLCEIDGLMTPDQIDELMYVGTSRAKTYLVILVGQNAPESVQSIFKKLRFQ